MRINLFLSNIVIVFLFVLAQYRVQQVQKQYNLNDLEKAFATGYQPQLQYGINVDSFYIEREKVRSNVYLSSLLSARGVAFDKIEALVKKSAGVFDIRMFRSGNPITFFSSKHDKQLNYFIYEHTVSEYVVFDLSDNIKVEKRQKEIKKVISTGTGSIEFSLWGAMEKAGLDPILALKLSDIYAWSFDFFGLQRGDRFNIIYEQLFVDTVPIGSGKILAARFENGGRILYAIPFTQDSVESFYDQNGNSLRKAFRKAPLEFARITSGFSYARFHPIYRNYKPHLGVDYAAPIGTPVLSIGDGTVVYKGYDQHSGNMVKIKHNGVYTTGYLHLSRYADGLQQGDAVKQGEVIGYVGVSGDATGPHLHFHMWQNGQPVNPLTIDAPSVEPIKDQNRTAFEQVKNDYIAKLDNITLSNTPNNALANNNTSKQAKNKKL